jgi:uncharacterized BrkB/YihY/UPF0761 family membrane protein
MVKQDRWIGVGVRVVMLTFLSTLLSFAVALLLSIIGTLVYARVEHASPNLMFAYKHIAFPVAVSAGAVALIVTLAMEVRNYRRTKVLAAIEHSAMNH